MASTRKRAWTSRGVERTAWVVDYFDQAGKRRLKTFKTKKEADAWSVTALHEVKQGVHTPASASITVAQCGARWLEHCAAEGLERGTIRQRQQHLNLHIYPFLGQMKLADLTLPRVSQFDIELRTGGRSTAMRQKVMTNLKTMLTFAQGLGLVAQNAARGHRRSKSEARAAATGSLREGVHFPSKGELKAMMEHAPDRWRALIVTAVFTGMRISELRGLPWRDVDLDAGVIHVRQRADAWRQLGAPKSAAGARDIPLAPIVINALRTWRPRCPAGEHDLVFPNNRGNIESLQNLRERVFEPLQRKAGMVVASGENDADGNPVTSAKYGFHALRHAAASLFIAHLGWTPKRVQVVMGHANISMTFDRYGHLFEDPEADREAMKKIEAAVVAA